MSSHYKTGRIKILTLYFTKDESTFSNKNFISVLEQVNVDQDIYVVSAKPINLEKRGFKVENIVIPTRDHWPIAVKIGYSFNTAVSALKKRGLKLEEYSYIFKIDSDVLLPRDYLDNLVSQSPVVGGIGCALLISVDFFEKVLNGKYPINYCDDTYVIAFAIATSGKIATYRGEGDIDIPAVVTIPHREILYGFEFYKWGMSPLILPILPLTRILLRVTKRMKKHREKHLDAYLYNYVGYLRALVSRAKKYEFHKEYGKKYAVYLYRKLRDLL